VLRVKISSYVKPKLLHSDLCSTILYTTVVYLCIKSSMSAWQPHVTDVPAWLRAGIRQGGAGHRRPLSHKNSFLNICRILECQNLELLSSRSVCVLLLWFHFHKHHSVIILIGSLTLGHQGDCSVHHPLNTLISLLFLLVALCCWCEIVRVNWQSWMNLKTCIVYFRCGLFAFAKSELAEFVLISLCTCIKLMQVRCCANFYSCTRLVISSTLQPSWRMT